MQKVRRSSRRLDVCAFRLTIFFYLSRENSRWRELVWISYVENHRTFQSRIWAAWRLSCDDYQKDSQGQHVTLYCPKIRKVRFI